MNATETRPPAASGFGLRPVSYAVRAQHDGASHWLVREAGMRQIDAGGMLVNTPEVITLGIHTASCCKPTGDVSYPWEGSCQETTPPDDLQILRYNNEKQAQGVADRANANAGGFVWYVIEHEWNPPADYLPPVNADSLAELEQRNVALRMQLAQAENDALAARLEATRETPALTERASDVPANTFPPPFGSGGTTGAPPA